MIGNLIKQAMDKDGWTIYRLSKATSFLRNNLSVILGKRGNPEWSTIQRILDTIGYEVILKKKGGEKPKSKPSRSRRRKGGHYDSKTIR
jgi:transcriptional regulator with XRE-family HTH domain